MNQKQLSGEPIIEAEGLSVSYGTQTVLDVPSLQVYPNEVLVIIGPNGSGKTTLLLCLTHLIRPATGTVSYRGATVADSAAVLKLHRRLAAVFQEPLLLSSSVWDNVTLGLRLRKVPRGEIKARTEKWLERFGIRALAKRKAKTLSSGEAKRASLARAFVLQPEVLFLDEPFTALDSPTRQALLEDFLSVLRETKVTTVMVTHDRNEALALADRVIVLIDGRIKQTGTPEDVFGSPIDEEVASFVEAGNIMHGVVSSQSGGLALVGVGEQHLEVVSDLTVGTKVTIFLHHEDVTLLLPSPQNLPSSARNHPEAKVVRVFPIGSQMKVTLDCGFPLVAIITRRSWEELGLRVGETVIASFKASSIHLIPRV